MHSQLRCADHIATIVQKGHLRDNLIHRCFTSKDLSHQQIARQKIAIYLLKPSSDPHWSITAMVHRPLLEDGDYAYRSRTEEIYRVDYWHVQSVILFMVKRATFGKFRAETTSCGSANCLRNTSFIEHEY